MVAEEIVNYCYLYQAIFLSSNDAIDSHYNTLLTDHLISNPKQLFCFLKAFTNYNGLQSKRLNYFLTKSNLLNYCLQKLPLNFDSFIHLLSFGAGIN